MSWRTTRLRYLAAAPISNGLGLPGIPGEAGWPRYIRTTDIEGPRRLRDDTRASQPPDVAAQAPVERGDLLFCCAGSLGATYLHLSDEQACYAGYLARVRFRSWVDPSFVSYWAESSLCRNQIETGAVRSTIDNFSARKVANLALLIPDTAVQRVVADFLDRECERISRLDGVLTRLEPVLDEAPLARFLELTQNRDLTRLGYHYEVQLGKMLDEGRLTTADFVPYLRNQNVDWDRFDLDDVKLMSLTALERSRYLVLPGDLLACEGRHVGKSAVWAGEISPIYFQKALHRIRPRGSWSARYLMWCLWLGNSRGDFYADGTGSTIPHLPAEKLRAVRIPWAERAEQDEIVDEVDAVRQSAEVVRRSSSRFRSRLAEYRDALITEAVTGQLDVTKLSDAQLDESARAVLEGEAPEVLAS